MPGPLSRLDQWLMRRSAATRAPRLNRALVGLTQAANFSRLWIAIAALLAAAGGRPGQRAARRGIVAIVIASATSNGPAKLLARRRRPAAHHGPALIRMPSSTSFPSGHSAAAFAFATGVCGELPVLLPLLGPLAGAVAYSRVHAGVHYPSDVAGGAVIGVVSGVLADRLLSGLEDPLPVAGEDL